MQKRFKDESGLQSNNNAKNIVIVLVLLIVFGIFSLYTYKTYIAKQLHVDTVTMSSESSQTQNMDDFKVGCEIRQLLISPDDNLKSFQLLFNKLGTQGSGKMEIVLSDMETNEIYYKDEVELSQIESQKYTTFTLPEELTNIKNQSLQVKLKILSKDDSLRITMPISTDKDMHTGLFFDNAPVGYDLAYKLIGGNGFFLRPLYFALFAFMAIFIILFYYLAFYKKLKPQTMFLVASLCFGVFYLLVFTPYSVPDEAIHVGSSYRFANKILGVGFGEPTVADVRDGDFANHVLKNVPDAGTYKFLLNNLFSTNDASEYYTIDVPFAGNWCQYIFTTAGVTIARLLNLGFVPMLYMGRLFNFIFFVVIMYFSIKLIPFGKSLICAIALMPITMMLAASFSYDVIMIGLSIFFVALSLNLAYKKERVKWYDIALLCLSGGFLVAGKAGIYIFVCLSALVIPMKKFKTKWGYFAGIGSVAIVCIIFMVKFNLLNIIGVSSSGSDLVMEASGVSGQSHTLSSIFTNPGEFFTAAVDTVNNELKDIVLGMFGERLSHLNIKVPIYIVLVSMFIAVFASVRSEDEEIYLTKRTKVLFNTICIMAFCAFLVVGYTWTTTNDFWIKGVQGRYFIPILPLLMFNFRSKNLVWKKDIGNKLFYASVLISVFVLMYSFTAFVSQKTIFLGNIYEM